MSSRRSHLYVTGTELAVLCLAIACAAFMLGAYLGHGWGVKQGLNGLQTPRAAESDLNFGWKPVGPDSNFASTSELPSPRETIRLSPDIYCTDKTGVISCRCGATL